MFFLISTLIKQNILYGGWVGDNWKNSEISENAEEPHPCSEQMMLPRVMVTKWCFHTSWWPNGASTHRGDQMMLLRIMVTKWCFHASWRPNDASAHHGDQMMLPRIVETKWCFCASWWPNDASAHHGDQMMLLRIMVTKWCFCASWWPNDASTQLNVIMYVCFIQINYKSLVCACSFEYKIPRGVTVVVLSVWYLSVKPKLLGQKIWIICVSQMWEEDQLPMFTWMSTHSPLQVVGIEVQRLRTGFLITGSLVQTHSGVT